jgi:hypothetical protein
MQSEKGQIAEPRSGSGFAREERRHHMARVLAGREACDHDERCERDQNVDEPAEDDAGHRGTWSRLTRSMDTGDLQGIAAPMPVDVEQAVGSFGTAAAQLGKHELGAESSVPDEPVSLGPSTSTSAQVAGVAGNGSDRVVCPHTAKQPSGSSDNGSRNV